MTPSAVSAALDLNLATTARIMVELSQRGYLHQISRREGYIAGPMLAALNTRENCFERLSAAAEEPLRHLAEQLQCQVNIAVWHPRGRIMLNYYLPERTMQPWDSFTFSGQWETATGRLLLATLPEATARRVLKNEGITDFPRAELQKIRDQKYVQFPDADLSIMGHLLELPQFPAAAFGFGVPHQAVERAWELSCLTAEKIKQQLIRPDRAF